MRITTLKLLACTMLLLASFPFPTAHAQVSITPAEARAIAKEAYIYGFPMVDSYRIMHAYVVDRANPEYKADWNQIRNFARVFTPEDKAVQTPNSDTPYSFLGMDLRAEPIVLTVPPIEKERYFSIQLIGLTLHPERISWKGMGSQLAACPERTVLHGHASLLGRKPKRWKASGPRRH